MLKNTLFKSCLFCFSATLLFTGCEKLVEIDSPVNSISTNNIFSTNKQAEWALASVYSKMINGTDMSRVDLAAQKNFSAGLTTLMGALASDEVYLKGGYSDKVLYAVNTNTVSTTTSSLSDSYWTSAYKTIYDANAVIEGIAESTSPGLQDSVRRQLSAEAKTIRAFTYFYLTNIFGDVPLVTTIDFNQTRNLTRAAKQKIYEQIIKDLKEAIADLALDFSVSEGQRYRINKWFAVGLLARVYLYDGKYSDAITNATSVINHSLLFGLETNPADVFKKNSREALFQLKPTLEHGKLKNGTPEGFVFNLQNLVDGPTYLLSEDFYNQFDANDKRRLNWVSTFMLKDGSGKIQHYPGKYKKGLTTAVANGEQEYYTVMRLAELYLIRAEANMLQSSANTVIAITDLNELRRRADVEELANTLTATEVMNAIARERQFELFVEWGHRWFDLIRTGKAEEVLSQIPYKSPWLGKYQLLYPIPTAEIRANSFLHQNPEYDKQ